MKNYELTYILAPHLTSDQATQHASAVDSFVQGAQGVILKSEKSGAKVLAYPIKKHRSGYYMMAEFQAPESAVQNIKAHIDGMGEVLRSFIVIKKPVKEMKALRRRKPSEQSGFGAVPREEKKGEKADINEIEKKLDELLS